MPYLPLSLYIPLIMVEILIGTTKKFVYQVLERSQVHGNEIDEFQVYEVLQSSEAVNLLGFSSKVYLRNVYLRKQPMRNPTINDNFR
jgi:hypothetical protein